MDKNTVRLAIEGRIARDGDISASTILSGISCEEIDCNLLSDDDLFIIISSNSVDSTFFKADLPNDRQVRLLKSNPEYCRILSSIRASAVRYILSSEALSKHPYWWEDVSEELSKELRIKILRSNIVSSVNKNIYISDYFSDNNLNLEANENLLFIIKETPHITTKDRIFLISLLLKNFESRTVAVSKLRARGIDVIAEYKFNDKIVYKKVLLNRLCDGDKATEEWAANRFATKDLSIILSIKTVIEGNFPYKEVLFSKEANRDYWIKNLDIVSEHVFDNDIEEDILLMALREMQLGPNRDRYIGELISNNCISFSDEGFEELFKEAFM